MKWMIVGAKGQLGSAVSNALSLQNIEHVSLSRKELDIRQENDVATVFFQECPDVVVNAAAWTNVDLAESNESLAYDVNVNGATLIAQECARRNTKLIHISTDYVFSGSTNISWPENAIPNPASV